VSPVKYELGFYIPEDDILHSHRRGHLKSYIVQHISYVREAICMARIYWVYERTTKQLQGNIPGRSCD
jgi:hypothetical protein